MVIAVTGKMAAGKNYVCSQLEKEGWSVVDADLVVHEAIDLAQDKIITTFEPYAKEHNIKIKKDSNGTVSIDRRALGQLLFSMPNLLKIQESIVYPIVIKKIEDFINSHDKTIINATVLYKTPELLHQCEKIIFVDAPFLTRLKRARKRDNLSVKEILKRFYSQRKLYQEYEKIGIPITTWKN